MPTKKRFEYLISLCIYITLVRTLSEEEVVMQKARARKNRSKSNGNNYNMSNKGVFGIHHVTAITSDPQRNIDFYANRRWVIYRIVLVGVILLIPILCIKMSPFLLVCILAVICVAQIIIDLQQHPYHSCTRVLK